MSEQQAFLEALAAQFDKHFPNMLEDARDDAIDEANLPIGFEPDDSLETIFLAWLLQRKLAQCLEKKP